MMGSLMPLPLAWTLPLAGLQPSVLSSSFIDLGSLRPELLQFSSYLCRSGSLSLRFATFPLLFLEATFAQAP